MAKQANLVMTGGFVVLAVLLLAVSVVLFGSGRFFKDTTSYVLYFDSSIKGLSVGAPVLFNGVEVGGVTNIMMLSDPEKLEYSIPVYIEIDSGKVQVVDGKNYLDPYEMLPKLIEKGLRGVLGIQSLITGKLMIELGYYPDTPVEMRKSESEILEIPTIASTTERLFQILQKSDLQGMMSHLENALSGIDTLINNPELGKAIQSMKIAADNAKNITKKLDGHVDPIANNLEGTLTDSRNLINHLDEQVEPISKDLKQTIEDFDSLILTAVRNMNSLTESFEASLGELRGVVSEDSPLIIEMQETLLNISEMAISWKELADYIDQHPESLLKGKGN